MPPEPRRRLSCASRGPPWTRRCGRSEMGVVPSPPPARLAGAAERPVLKEILWTSPDSGAAGGDPSRSAAELACVSPRAQGISRTASLARADIFGLSW
jgi:hypothetical protein